MSTEISVLSFSLENQADCYPSPDSVITLGNRQGKFELRKVEI